MKNWKLSKIGLKQDVVAAIAASEMPDKWKAAFTEQVQAIEGQAVRFDAHAIEHKGAVSVDATIAPVF